MGLPCVFIRTSGCKLRCTWCDTTHAYHEGEWMSFDSILEAVQSYDIPLVEVTGGEPMEQEYIHEFLAKLISEGFEVLLETGGHICLKKVPAGVIRIMDVKLPASKMERQNELENLNHLRPGDQVKFVVQDRKDMDFAIDIIKKYKLESQKDVEILISPVFGEIEPRVLVEWCLESKLSARFQLQLHKMIWPADARGV